MIAKIRASSFWVAALVVAMVLAVILIALDEGRVGSSAQTASVESGGPVDDVTASAAAAREGEPAAESLPEQNMISGSPARAPVQPDSRAPWAALSAQQAISAALALPPGNIDRDTLLRWVTSSCRHAELRQDGPPPGEIALPGTAEGAARRLELYRAWQQARRQWCAGSEGVDWGKAGASQRKSEFVAAGSDAEKLDWLNSLLALDPAAPEWRDPGFLDDLWRILETSDSPTLIRTAASRLAISSEGPLALATDAAQINTLVSHGVQSQAEMIRLTAAEVFFCRTTGGCGPGTAFGLLGDPWISEEHRRIGREAVMRDALTARHWQAVEQIVAEMQARRAQALARRPAG